MSGEKRPTVEEIRKAVNAEHEHCDRLAEGTGVRDNAESICSTLTEALAVMTEQLEASTAIRAEVERERNNLLAAAELAARDIAFFHHGDRPFVTDGKTNLPIVVSLLVSDTFAFACADAELIRLDEAPEVLRLHDAGGWPAVIAFVAERRKADPIKPVKARMREMEAMRKERDAAIGEARRLNTLVEQICALEVTSEAGRLKLKLHEMLEAWAKEVPDDPR